MAEAVIPVVTVQGAEHVLTHAFLLQAKGHDGISPLEGSIKVATNGQ